jgi:tRNA pseudouridine38-40 synthase
MRLALGIEYNGTNFNGWQIQSPSKNTRTVQACVEQALSFVANHKVKTICAGRTDAGVHALEQVIHVDVKVEREMCAWILGTNSKLPTDISILWAKLVPQDFHARFSAKTRHYRYIILNRPARSAIYATQKTWISTHLDANKMQQAANYLLGTHNFNAYRASDCEAKNPIRTIKKLSIFRQKEQIIIEITANAFLKHMVRNIVGVLIEIGQVKKKPIWSKEVLISQDRNCGGKTASPHGLYLSKIDY